MLNWKHLGERLNPFLIRATFERIGGAVLVVIIAS